MNGDFKTDITRDSFRRHKNFSRVLMQQGRVQLDADWNEQNDILLHYMRTLAQDIIGPHAGPKDDVGFAIEAHPASATPASSQQETSKRGGAGGKSSKKTTDQSENAYQVNIKRGRYYVDGILCESDRDIVYTLEDEQQPNKQSGTFLFYLDVWEREVTYLEDDSIREVALNGADTATRAQVVYQIRTRNIANLEQKTTDTGAGFPNYPPDTTNDSAFAQFVTDVTNSLRIFAPDFFPLSTSVTPPIPSVSRPMLKAKTREIEDDEQSDPCTIPPTSQYRGAENQLYRVEVHTSGYGIPPSSGQQRATQRSQQSRGTSQRGVSAATTQTPNATFKWSRENGSVTFPIVGQIPPNSTGDITVTLVGLGRDDSRFAINTDDWVEIVDYEDTLELEAGQLMRIKAVDYVNSTVTLTTAANQTSAAFDTDSNPNKPQLLRRWDYTEMDPTEKGATTLASDGGLEIIENHWLTLEDGIQVLFHRDIDQQSDKDADDQPPYYHTGDYWLIPARAATGKIEWPQHKEEHDALPPHGVVHHYAPLAYVPFNENGGVGNVIDLRRQINQIWAQVLHQ